MMRSMIVPIPPPPIPIKEWGEISAVQRWNYAMGPMASAV
jgi:hypothetical protein